MMVSDVSLAPFPVVKDSELIKQIQEFVIEYPPVIEEQKAIVHKLNEMLKETQRLEALYQRKIALLDELKKSLLQQAFSGEL